LEALAAVRDVAIIILAVESIVIGGAVLFLVLQTWNLVGLVRRYVETFGTSATSILGTVQDTAHSVQDTARTTQGTAGFVADRTAKPVIELYSAVSGASRFVRALFSPHRAEDREEPS
jgi:hypothetical protein